MLEMAFNETKKLKQCERFLSLEPDADAEEYLIQKDSETGANNRKKLSKSSNVLQTLEFANAAITRRFKIKNVLLFFCGTSFLACGIILYIWPLFDLMMSARLRMITWLPPYQEWVRLKPAVFCRVHLFTVTNADAFLSGKDSKMKIQDFGPIVYREIINHSEVVFNENSTLTYRIQRHLEFVPEMNRPGILNETITVPNIPLLAMAAKITNLGFTIKMPFNLLSRDDRSFINTTVYNYLWNLTTPALRTAVKYLPSFLVPMDNGGTLHVIYNNFDDRVNVKIGPKYRPQEFFQINSFNYVPVAPGYRPERGDCFASVLNSSEGAAYSNLLDKSQPLYYWRKTACRPIPLYFQKEVQRGKLRAYNYVPKSSVLDRLDNLTADCYKGFEDEVLPDGLSDVSKCYNEMPIAMSLPHFYGRNGPWMDQLEGFEPSFEKHHSHALIEPVMGVALEQTARSQCNLILPKLNGFHSKINRFSKRIVPMIWLEYNQPEVTPEIEDMLNFATNILPRIQYVVPVIFIILSLTCYLIFLKNINQNDSYGKYLKFQKLWQRKAQKIHLNRSS